VKIIIKSGPKKSQVNPFGQVSLSVLKFWGRKTAYFTQIKNEQIPLISNNDAIDKILIGLGVPVDLIAWFDEDVRNFGHSPIDEESKITLEDMIKLKNQCIETKDYSGLKSLVMDIKKVFEIGIEIWKWRKELDFCVAKEDFSRAIELKNKYLT
jgi:centrosomal protein CEP104